MLLCTFIFAFFIQLVKPVKYLEPHQDWEIPTYENLFQGRMWGSNNYRIPAVAYMKDDTILALTDFRYNHAGDLPAKIGVGGRKRFNNGTWTSGFIITGTPVRNVGDGDVAVVVDRKTGCVFAVWSGDKGFQGGPGSISTAANPAHVYFSRSWDNGESWEERHDITKFIYSHLCTECDDHRKYNISKLFVTSGTGCQMRDGKLVFAVLAADHVEGVDKENQVVNRNYVLYTDDMGDTWDLAKGRSVDGADEAKLVELNNGDLLLSIRFYYERKFQWSKDAGDTWYRSAKMQNVSHFRTNGDIKRMTSTIDGFEKNRLLHTLVYSGNARRNVSLAISYDEGETWPYRKSIEYYGSAYSAIDINKEGEIFFFYEKDGLTTYDMNMAKVSLEWLTDGFDHYEKPKLLKWCYLTDPKNENEASKCPSETYKNGYKVFDQYIESYMVYPKEVQYTFVDKFRDINVDLSLEGLNKGSYNRLSSDDRTKINFNGHSTHDHPPRTLAITNFDISIPASEIPNIDLTLTNGDITVKNCSSLDVFVSSNSDKLGIRLWDDESKSKLYSISSTKNIIFEVSGQVNVYHPSKFSSNSKKLLEGSSISKIQFVSTNIKEPVTVKMMDEWSQDEGSKISFVQDSKHQMIVEVKQGSENNFDNSGSDDSKPPIHVIPDPTSKPTEPPSSEPSSAPTSEPSSAPSSAPSSVPTVEPSNIPTNPQTPSNSGDDSQTNQTKESKGVPLAIAIVIGVAGLVIGLAIGLIILFATRKRSSKGGRDESQSGMVFTPILD